MNYGGKHLAPPAGSPSPADPVWQRRAPRPLRRFAVILAFCVLAVVSVVAGFSVAERRPPWMVVLGAFTPSPQALFHKNRILVLIEGLDYDYNPLDEEYSSRARSDVIKAADLDFNTKNVWIVAVPRDMDATMTSGREDKINQAQSDGGIGEAQSVISSFLGIPSFDRYVILRINATKDLIDAIGGIDLNVKNSDALMGQGPNGPIDYDDTWGHLHIHLKPGLQHLNGEQAVGYGRFRHDWCSDPCRIKRQDQVIEAFISKLRGDKFNTLLHLNDLIGVFNKDVDTNFSRAEEVSLAMSFADMPGKSALHTTQIPYVNTKVLANGGEVLIPDEQKKAQLVQKYLLDPPQPRPPANTAVAIVPSNVRVAVQNGTGISGLAKRVATILKSKGFTISAVGNAPTTNVALTQVHEHTRIAGAGLSVRDALGSSASRIPVIPDTAAQPGNSDVTIILGQDVTTLVNQPSQ